MDMNKTVKMAGNISIATSFINSESYLTECLLEFWNTARCNPMVAFETEWGCNTNITERNTNRARITMLKLCNLDNTCLLIDLSALDVIPDLLIKFLAVKDIRFVGVNISKDLQKLKEDYGIEIRNAIELTTLAAENWDEVDQKRQQKSYETWGLYRLEVPSKKIDIPLGGVRLLYTAFLGKTLSSKLPSQLVSEDAETTLDFHYLTAPVYAALQVAVQLLILY